MNMPALSQQRVTDLLVQWSQGDDAALAELTSDLSYGDLKLMPWWDPRRGDPRFDKLVEEAKQPVALK